MFDNIGGKIKTLAVVICVIGMISSVIGGIVLWTQNSRYAPTILPGIIVIVAGCLGSWVGSFFTYGFGELIENTDRIVYNTSRMANNQGSAPAARTTPINPPRPVVSSGTTDAGFWRCKSCGTTNKSHDVFCRDCGTYK